MRVVLLSVTEGEDKPLKYPPMFHSADVALVTKSDLADAVDFNRDAALAALNKVAHHAHVIEVSSKTGEGMEAWCEEIVERARRAREGTIQHHTITTIEQAAAALKFEIAGMVQGVGFRPHVYRLAVRHGLKGFVRNTESGVEIHVEGEPGAPERFWTALMDGIAGACPGLWSGADRMRAPPVLRNSALRKAIPPPEAFR